MDNPKQTALITGASRGIGRGIALSLAREGFNCVINYASNTAAAEQVKLEIEQSGAGAIIVQADVSLASDRRRLVETAFEAYGHIDLLVNNAGITSPGRADLLDADEESFDRVIATNLKGPFFLTQLLARRMIESIAQGLQRSPKIVNITSVSAYAVSANRGDYCIAKAGLSMMTQLFAARLAEHGINVYEIRPGIIETDMTGPVKAKYDKMIAEGLSPIARWGTTDDVARAVVAIARDLLPFSTGEIINVDGGFHMRRL
jgi:NAD(P)-dependent dehydrogenase (short-subunit alcohol dehydrogenase family)